MTDPINVDTDAMLAAVVEFDGKHDDIQKQVMSLQGEFDGLSATWGGDAARAFQGAMQGFYQDCDAILESLFNIAREVDLSVVKYNQAHGLSVDAAVALQKNIYDTPAGLPGF